MEMNAQQHLEQAEALLAGFIEWGEQQMLPRAMAAQTHVGIARALLQQGQDAALRRAYARGRNDEATGSPIPEEYR